MMSVIIITYRIKEHLIEHLKTSLPFAEVCYLPDKNSPTERYRNCKYYLGHITRDEFISSPNLKLIQSAYAGVEEMLFPELLNSNVILCAARGIHGVQMREYIFGLLLYLGRNVQKWEEQKEKKIWDTKPFRETFSLKGLTMCIVGYGTIGKQIAEVAKVFGMSVVGVKSTVQKEIADEHPEKILSTEKIYEVLPESDVVINLLPLTERTNDFFNAEIFSSMKEGSIFINVGRGATVQDDALLSAIRDGKIRWAILDVFREEPLLPEHLYWKEPRVIITPHISGLMPHYMSAVVDIFIENVKRVEAGEQPLNVVDKRKGY